MCGILGHFSFGASRADAELWQRLVGLLAHRGPDDGTFWHDDRFVFGHRRLSIIDLSRGHQPMATDDGALVVTFNGEIYNYLELREELEARGHCFRTQSDTEVLLHGYREWGVELPARLLGMFAFAIADRRRHELFCARDRFGEKPFLYSETGDGVAFASELKVLAALPRIRPEINEQALVLYLCLNYVPGTDTMMRGVERLRPGTWRLWTAGGTARAGTYWQPPGAAAPDLPLSMRAAVDQLEPLIDASARLSLRSDVPVGIFLSGGIDSSLIAESAARSGRLAAAFCLTFSEASYSEWPRAERTARHLGLPLIEVRLGAEALSSFHELVAHADDPLADSSALAVYTLSREVARHVKVVLSGDGGDELFGGYLTYQATRWHGAITARLPFALRRLLARGGRGLPTSERKVSASYKLRRYLRAADLRPSIAHFTWNGTWLPEEAATLVVPPLQQAAGNALEELVRAHGLADNPSLRALQTADVTEYLPNDILAKSDRMSMAHGLEVRAPLLDPELAAFALRLPPALKSATGSGTKRVLRELATRKYGVAVGAGAKQGFSIPVHEWLRGPARPLIEDLLSDRALADVPQLHGSAIRQAVIDHMTRRRSYGFELWGLAVLVAWHKLYVASRIPIPDGPLPRPVAIAACPV